LYASIKAASEEYSSSINDRSDEDCCAQLSIRSMASDDLIEKEEHDSITLFHMEKIREYISLVG
jgi:hypothetical protein